MTVATIVIPSHRMQQKRTSILIAPKWLSVGLRK